MKVKQAVPLLLVLCLLLGLSACGGTAPQNQLVLYSDASPRLTAAVKIYKDLYPDVDVVMEEIPQESFNEQLTTDLMGGGGPDVLIVGMQTFLDLYKVLNQETFLDLTPFLEEDEDFSPEKLVQPVMDAGVYRGKQYLIPYHYITNTIVAETRILEDLGLESLPETTDFTEFWTRLMDAGLRERETNPNMDTVIGGITLHGLLTESGVELIDREAGTVLADEAGLRELTEIYKRAYRENVFGTEKTVYLYDEVADALKSRSILMAANPNSNLESYACTLAYAKTAGETVEFPLPTLADGACASVLYGIGINAASQNAENAWNFLKVYLSEAVYEQILSPYLSAQRGVMDWGMDTEFWTRAEDSASKTSGMLVELTEEEMRAHLEAVTHLTRVKFYEKELWNFYLECMEPYLNDTDSYENCVNALRERLTIYVTE